MRKILTTLAAFLLFAPASFGQAQFTSVLGQGWTVEGRLWHEFGFSRWPAKAKGVVRDQVWALGQNSSGLKVRFWTDAPVIHLKYAVGEKLAKPHMPATGVSGFDLYRQTETEGLRWVGAIRPGAKSGMAQVADSLAHTPGKPALYTLYLPLYNTVQDLQLGVPDGFRLSPAIPDRLKPIVVYGTSIAQGACATRPGLAWVNTLERRLEWPIVNLGFSGNGRMELEVADLFLAHDAAVYVIDCLPNLRSHQVRERIGPLLDRIREKRPNTPILLVEGPLPDNGYWRPKPNEHILTEWKVQREEFERRKSTDPNLHYLTGEHLLGSDGEGTVDAIHPNDLGMARYADAYETALRPILHLSNRAIGPDARAVFQLREYPHYNYLERHQRILDRHKAVSPDVVWLGDSIIHYFGGEPKAKHARGQQAWDGLMQGKVVTNLGYGWDLTENVLWRIQRGELAGIEPKTILLSIGTNDLSFQRMPQDIAEAIHTLAQEIRTRQPQAKLIVSSILPRGGYETKRLALNLALEAKAEAIGYTFVDLSPAFPVEMREGEPHVQGTYDQLHPDAEGYLRLAERLTPHLQDH